MRSLVLLSHEQQCSADSGNTIIGAVCGSAFESEVISVHRLQDALQIRRGPVVLASQPCQSPPESLFLAYLIGRATLSLIWPAGDICSLQLLDGGAEVEVLGDIESGISAAVWSPDEEILALATHDGRLLLLDSDYEVLSEKTLRPPEYGRDAPVALGWGDKTTQFHGSVGKDAARTERQEQASDWLRPGDDDEASIISWRGDGAHFCVSSWESDDAGRHFRKIRLYSRSGDLLNTGESVPGLEQPLAWQPSGSIVASIQRSQLPDGSLARDVVFFERNGLRRYEFNLTRGQDVQVRKLVWNADSSCLAVWLKEAGRSDRVRLYMRSNYHWYLKYQSEALQNACDIFFHSEEPLHLYVTTRQALRRLRFGDRIIASQRLMPNDTGSVAVIDGCHLLVSALGNAMTPPPMSASKLEAAAPIIDAAWDTNTDVIASLDCNAVITVWRDKSEMPNSSHQLDTTYSFPRQLAVISIDNSLIVAILSGSASLEVLSLNTASKAFSSVKSFSLQRSVSRLVSAFDCFMTYSEDGSIDRVNPDGSFSPSPGGLPAHCLQVYALRSNDMSDAILCGLANDARLFSSLSTDPIATHCTSFCVCGDLVLYTTSASQLYFFDLTARARTYPPRRIERGAKLVTSVPSKALVILQMPRGNLEAIYPRPLIYAQLQTVLAQQRFLEAFTICRKHRIDFNVICDYDEPAFMLHLETLLVSLETADDINLFLAALSDVDASGQLTGADQRGAQRPGKANRLLNECLSILQGMDIASYATCILTAHLSMKPPDFPEALRLLAHLRTSEQQLEEAVAFVFFLEPDADAVFNEALRTYDLKLALLVAQHSQKDPKEYLPFLRDLHTSPLHWRCHRIDDHLKNYKGALTHLAKSDDAKVFEAAKDYILKHQLYDAAVTCYAKHRPYLPTILNLRGEWHMLNGRPLDAAPDFAMARNRERQLDALKAGLAWQEVFSLLLSSKALGPASRSAIATTGRDLAENLTAARRYAEAARVQLDYSQDVAGAISTLCLAGQWAEAQRWAFLYSRGDLLATSIAQAASAACDMQVQAMEEIASQISRQSARLEELQSNRERERQLAAGHDEDDMPEHEVASEDSTAAVSQFTRYTVASANTVKSGATARSRRKQVLKQLAGKRDTIHEDVYIYNSLVKVATDRLAAIQGDLGPLLACLLSLETETGDLRFRNRAIDMQHRLSDLEADISQCIDAVWSSEPDDGAVGVRPDRPVAASLAWRLALLDLLTDTVS